MTSPSLLVSSLAVDESTPLNFGTQSEGDNEMDPIVETGPSNRMTLESCLGTALLSPLYILGGVDEVTDFLKNVMYSKKPSRGEPEKLEGWKIIALKTFLSTASLGTFITTTYLAVKNVGDAHEQHTSNSTLGIFAGIALVSLTSRLPTKVSNSAREVIAHMGNFITPVSSIIYLNGGPPFWHWWDVNNNAVQARATSASYYYFSAQGNAIADQWLVSTALKRSSPSDSFSTEERDQNVYLETTHTDLVKIKQTKQGNRVFQTPIWNRNTVAKSAAEQLIKAALGGVCLGLGKAIKDDTWNDFFEMWGWLLIGSFALSVTGYGALFAKVRYEKLHPTTYEITDDGEDVEAIVDPTVKIMRRVEKISEEFFVLTAAALFTIPAPLGESIPRSKAAIAAAGALLTFSAKGIALRRDAITFGKRYEGLTKTRHIAPAVIFTLYATLWIAGMFDPNPPPLPPPIVRSMITSHLVATFTGYGIAGLLGENHTSPRDKNFSTRALNSLRFYFCEAPYMLLLPYIVVRATGHMNQVVTTAPAFIAWAFLGLAMGSAAAKTAADRQKPAQISTVALFLSIYTAFAIAQQGNISDG